MITKDDFLRYMEDLEKTVSYQKDLNKLFDRHNIEGYLCRPDCSASLIRILNQVMHVEQQDDYITKFVFESNFGKIKNDKMIYIDKNRKQRKIENAEQLYNLLVDLPEKNEVKTELVNMD